MKKVEEMCTKEQISNLTGFRIELKNNKMKKKDHKLIEKQIKRARILGLLPFSAKKLYS